MGKKGLSYPKYKTPEAMQEKIEEYFRSCEGHKLRDDKSGEILCDKNGLPIIVGAQPYTVTGLALALGFKSRQALLNYQAKSAKFDAVISAAKLRIENYAEKRLFDREGTRGAQFNLRNNYGWSDNPERESDSSEGGLIGEIVKAVSDIE